MSKEPPVSAYAKPGPYLTQLSPYNENLFQTWVHRNQVPFDPSPTADYDMRGFFQGLLDRHPLALTSINPNDGKLHFPDYWKTPYHQSFSNESQYALPTAPRWINDHQLADTSGKVVFDEQASHGVSGSF